jgi:hypothetical protein
MSRRPSTCQRIRQRSLQFAAVLAAVLAPQAPARADLSWFDVAVSEDRPHVSLADVVAWSDACLDIKAEEVRSRISAQSSGDPCEPRIHHGDGLDEYGLGNWTWKQ